MKICISALCIVTAALVISLPLELRVYRKMRRYRNRACTGFQWRRRFPDASKNDIRDFLGLFVDAFGFRRSRRLCFSPDDKVIEIYRTRYDGWIIADDMELEELALLLHAKYGIDTTTFWSENITLGELFTHTRAT